MAAAGDSGPSIEPPTTDLLDAVGHGESLAELPFSADIRFTFQSICEELADRLGRRLKHVLRGDVTVRCGDIIADTFAAWILGIEQPTCFLVASLLPLEGKLLLDLPTDFVFPALEQLLGGQPQASGTMRRPLTELEQRLCLRLSDAILDSYAGAWQTMVCLQPAVERMESNPRVVRCLPALEPMLISSLAISLEGVESTIRVAIPIRGAVAACHEPEREQDRLAHPRDRVTQPMSACLELTWDESAASDFEAAQKSKSTAIRSPAST